MPGKSIKKELQELLLMLGMHDFIFENSKDRFMEDDEFLILSQLVNMARYSGPRYAVPKSDNWLSAVLFSKNLNEARFRQHLRMNRLPFYFIHDTIKDNVVFYNTKTPVAVQLVIALTQLGGFGNGCSYELTASKFGLSEGTVNNFTERVIGALNEIGHQWVRWPDVNERKIIGSQMVQELLPKCIGFVDGSDIPLFQAPIKEKEVYWSRKKKYCMQMQIVCDTTRLIRHVFTGYPGSVHDSKVYNSCDLFLSPANYFSDGEYLIGDSAYAKSETLVTPYKRNRGVLTIPEKRFNRHVSSKRVAVEHTIGILKGRFQSLQGLRIIVDGEKGNAKVCRWIYACVILHNILMAKDPWNQKDDFIFHEESVEDNNEIITGNNNAGEIKRSALCEIVNSML